MTRAEIITEIKSNFESHDGKALRVDGPKLTYVITYLYEATNKDLSPCLMIDALEVQDGNIVRGHSTMLQHGADRGAVDNDYMLADIYAASAISDNYITDLVVVDR